MRLQLTIKVLMAQNITRTRLEMSQVLNQPQDLIRYRPEVTSKVPSTLTHTSIRSSCQRGL